MYNILIHLKLASYLSLIVLSDFVLAKYLLIDVHENNSKEVLGNDKLIKISEIVFQFDCKNSLDSHSQVEKYYLRSWKNFIQIHRISL